MSPCGDHASLDAVIREYTANLGRRAELNQATVTLNLGNLKRKLGPKVDVPIDRIGPGDLEAFVQARWKERARSTVSKERDTVVQFFSWAVAQRYLVDSPATDLTKVKSRGDLPVFRTLEEIEAIIARGGLSPKRLGFIIL